MADSKKYNGSTWEHSLRKLATATEPVENPLYSDGTAITAYTIKGNTVQNGTPTPSTPVPVVGTGELETTGEHSGEYKIPISSGGVITNIYLGSTQTVRQIKKLVLTGQENITKEGGNAIWKIPTPNLENPGTQYIYWFCSHYESVKNSASWSTYDYCITWSSTDTDALRIRDKDYPSSATLESFKQYLAQQYANGTPVTIWYVLETPQTAAVNEPLMKIGDYADTLSNATSIPTTEGANSITVDTTVQPSEFTATWTGWHDSSVKEWDGSDWQ